MDDDKIICTSLELAKVWGFNKRDTSLLYKELINYKNDDPLFDVSSPSSSQSLCLFWADFTGHALLLRRFAMKILVILLPDNLSIIGQLKNKLKNDAPKVNKKSKVISEPSFNDDENINIFFEDDDDDQQVEKLIELEESDEELNILPEEDDLYIIEEFFDFMALKKDQEALNENLSQADMEPSKHIEKE
ncbi:7919_t:CDS:2, partial [Cetraspora pellucida]